jgi:hypothetical protein
MNITASVEFGLAVFCGLNCISYAVQQKTGWVLFSAAVAAAAVMQALQTLGVK